MERRLVLKGLMASGMALTASGTARAHEEAANEEAAPAADPAPSSAGPWELLAPVGPGSDLGSGWTAHALAEVSHGAAILTLTHPTRGRARVHVCKRAGAARGVACTRDLDLLLMNGGDGNAPTDEGLSRAVKTLALRMTREDERRGAQPRSAGLLTHPTRLGWFCSDGVLE